MSPYVIVMEKIKGWYSTGEGGLDIILPVVFLIAIMMILLPLPTVVVDILIAVNITASLILLLIAISIGEPLELSVFPTLLLITTIFRLALTVSTTRLVLLQHDAGNIVDAFGHFVVSGNLTVGLVIFSIITIVQFIVITKGTERVAEVSARFSLDGMPGKQMSIDGDMRAGAIDASQARQMRQMIQQESRFLGAMDGAMKFVKGDAIAGIIVVLVNIIGGMIIGVVQHNMPLADAVQKYSVLSIGDGLCGQIPSLLISLSAGVIVTRVPGEKKQNLSRELSAQIGRQPRALVLTAVVMLLLAIVPGFPFFIFFPLAVVLAMPLLFTWHQRYFPQGEPERKETALPDTMTPGVTPMMLRFGAALEPYIVEKRIDALRWKLFEEYGVPLPEVTLLPAPGDDAGKLTMFVYQIPVLSVIVPEECPYLLTGKDARFEGKTQTLNEGLGTITWLNTEVGQTARAMGITVAEGADRITVLLEKVFLRHMAEFIGVQEAYYLMNSMERDYAELVKELQRQLPSIRITEVLRRLVAEKVTIRDLRLIFGTLIEWGPREKDVLMLTEYVRVALRRHLLHQIMPPDGILEVIHIGEVIENLIRESTRQTVQGSYTALSSGQNAKILERITDAVMEHGNVCIVTSIDARRYLRKMTEDTLFDVPVLSWQELGENCQVRVVCGVDIDPEESCDEQY
ncbi:EscV/YscV/HrcV family type III secretion system export apparatus protein [unidentified bacterial endosymbiont]|uniref:EscV/YscV/HrcV family type III secretion system export apparatus protein n=1 Tax=unidentified bacterial endosymbiont TaxID=2355 RepID=UPI003F512138